MIQPDTTTTAAKAVSLIVEKHTEDLVVTECKNGPTQGYNHSRMDVWVMRKSWVNMSAICYAVSYTHLTLPTNREV